MSKTVSKSLLMFVALLVAVGCLFVAVQSASAEKAYAANDKMQEVYRLYNKWTNEHLYTTDKTEYDKLVKKGWTGENVAWLAPKSGTTVYRLYNQWSGDHHYTTDAKEYKKCIKAGWTDEHTAFYSGGDLAIYRLFNPYEKSFYHHYPSSVSERDKCVKTGWKDEGVGWYGYNPAVYSDSGRSAIKNFHINWDSLGMYSTDLSKYISQMASSSTPSDAYIKCKTARGIALEMTGTWDSRLKKAYMSDKAIQGIYGPDFLNVRDPWGEAMNKLGGLLQDSDTEAKAWANRNAIKSACDQLDQAYAKWKAYVDPRRQAYNANAKALGLSEL